MSIQAEPTVVSDLQAAKRTSALSRARQTIESKRAKLNEGESFIKVEDAKVDEDDGSQMAQPVNTNALGLETKLEHDH